MDQSHWGLSQRQDGLGLLGGPCAGTVRLVTLCPLTLRQSALRQSALAPWPRFYSHSASALIITNHRGLVHGLGLH